MKAAHRPMIAMSMRIIGIAAVMLACLSTSVLAQTPIRPDNQPSLLQMLVRPVEPIADWLLGFFSKEENQFDRDLARFKQSVESDLSKFSQFIRAAGYTLSKLSIDAERSPTGRSPVIVFTLDFVRRLEPKERLELQARLNDENDVIGLIERSIIQILLDATDSLAAVRSDGFRYVGLNVTVDAVPAVTFRLEKPTH
ncbi:exported hypothetical protein [Azospirillaceae bacterium]